VICEQFPLPLEYTDGHKPSVFPSMKWELFNDVRGEQFPSPLEYTDDFFPSVFPLVKWELFTDVGCEQFPSPLEYTNSFCSIGVSIGDVHSE